MLRNCGAPMIASGSGQEYCKTDSTENDKKNKRVLQGSQGKTLFPLKFHKWKSQENNSDRIIAIRFDIYP